MGRDYYLELNSSKLSPQNFVDSFIHFKLIISNIIKTYQLTENKISLINGILLNGDLIPDLFDNFTFS